MCADFDRDGIVDLAVTSSSTNAVLLLRGGGANGVGDGSFGAPVPYAVGVSPARLVAADVSGDGILDLVVANNGGASISILLGRGDGGVGDGTFQPAASIPVAGSPWGVAALDWNGDGVADLVVSNGAGINVTLLRGTGGGAFAAAGAITTPVAPRDLVVGDFDGDGITDVATACAVGNVVCVLHGTGSGFTVLNSFAAGSGAGAGRRRLERRRCPRSRLRERGRGHRHAIPRHLPRARHGAASRCLSPRGRETWWPGTVQHARWTRGAGVTAVDVDLSRDGGQTWLPLVREETALQVAVPALGVPGQRLRVRVRDTLVPARADASPADFTLCGVLGPAVVSDAGSPVTAMATADLDGDGVPDLVVAGDSARDGAARGRRRPVRRGRFVPGRFDAPPRVGRRERRRTRGPGPPHRRRSGHAGG